MATEGTTADTPGARLDRLLEQLDDLAQGWPHLERFAHELRREIEAIHADRAQIEQWCTTIATVCEGAADALRHRHPTNA